MFKDGLISQTDFFTQEQRFIQGKLRLENFKEVFCQPTNFKNHPTKLNWMILYFQTKKNKEN